MKSEVFTYGEWRRSCESESESERSRSSGEKSSGEESKRNSEVGGGI